MNKLHVTSAMTFALHSVLSLLIGALVAGLTALGQAIFTSGDPKVIIGAGIAAFGAWFVHGFVSLATNPQTIQASVDTVKAVEDLRAQMDQHSAAIASLQSVASQPAPAPQPAPQFVQPFPYQASSTFPQVPAVTP